MLEMLVTSVNYGDCLRETIPHNVEICDKIYLVTSQKDILSQEICARFPDKVKCIVSDVFFENGAIFNKGKGLNLAFKAAEKKDWLLISDADILLPTNLKDMIADIRDKDALYGINRIIIKEKHNLETAKRVSLKATYIGKPYELSRMHPIRGYFQLFHTKSMYYRNKGYRTDIPTAASSDLSFSHQWPKNKSFCFKADCIHLGQNAQNWEGRVTSFFK